MVLSVGNGRVNLDYVENNTLIMNAQLEYKYTTTLLENHMKILK